MLVAQGLELLVIGFGRFIVGFFNQVIGQDFFAMAGGVIVELLFEFGTRHLFPEYFDQGFAQARFVEHRPWHGGFFEDVLADRIGLFLLALQFQLAGFLLPVVQGRILLRHIHFVTARPQVKQVE